MNRLLASVAALTLVCAATTARAEVVESTDAGFVLRHTTVVAAPPDQVWKALTRLPRWWDPEHTYSGDARRLSLEVRPGGCWCERLDGGGGVEHGRVALVMPNQTLRVRTALGPLQSEGAAGALTWTLKAVEGGTELTQTYEVGGRASGAGLTTFAPIVDRVMGVQHARLARYAATGNPEAPAN